MRNMRPMSSIMAISTSVILMSTVLFSCENKENQYNKEMKKILNILRQVEFPVLNEKQREQWLFYKAIYGEEPDTVQAFLDKGFDPNYCHGECGWVDSNPLAVVAESAYTTYYRHLRGEEIPDITPDVVTLQVLVAGGADINQRPYIWDRVHRSNNKKLNESWISSWISDSIAEITGLVEKDYKAFYIKDENRIIEAFLKAGADPDKLGHPYPFSYEALRAGITDEQAQEYFSKGTRAINEAIEKGMAWESQVDLLLQYTQLDEESLRAAERSNDAGMVKKIQKLWENQSK